MWRRNKKVAIYKPEREVSRETNPTDSLILDFQPAKPRKEISAI